MGVNNDFPTQTEGLAAPVTPPPDTEMSAAQTTPTSEPALETGMTESNQPVATESAEAAETASPTTQPPLPVSGVENAQLLWGGLAVAFALLAAVIVALLRKKKSADTAPESQPQQTTPVPTVPESPSPAPVAPAAPPPVQVAYYQHIGAREDQQDSYAVSNPAGYDRQGVLALVADGMGGLSNGGAVSATVVRSFMESFRSVQAPPGELLLEAAARTNVHVNQMLRDGEKSGSTLVAVIIREGLLNFLSVGDSRIYLYRGGALLQLNREHTYREELAVRAVNQEIPMSRVRGDRQSHALTSYFGIDTIPHIDRNDEAIRLLPGDRLLLASDGVFGTLAIRQLETAMALEISESAKEIENLIRQANIPHQDNNTAVILQYNG